jgi:hypothetical protein
MWNIAQVNIGRIKGLTMEDPIMKDFVDKLDEINALAEGSPGFVWRLKDDAGNATAIQFSEDNRIIVNMSVWKDIPSLQQYVYKSNHREVLKRRREWFEHMTEFIAGMWYVPANAAPTIADAQERLKHLNEHGPTPFCFTFAKPFSADDHVHFMAKSEGVKTNT